MEKSTITLSAKGSIILTAGEVTVAAAGKAISLGAQQGMELSVAGGDFVLVGGPLVKVNP